MNAIVDSNTHGEWCIRCSPAAPGLDMDMMSSSMMGSQSYYMAEYTNGAWSTVEGPAMMSETSMMMSPASAPISVMGSMMP